LTLAAHPGHRGGVAKPSWQGPTIRVIGWTVGAFWLLLFFGLVDLSVPLFFQSRPEFYEGYLIETGWGVLFTFFAGIPMCVLGVRSDWTSAALLPAASGVAVLVACLASGQPVQLIIVAALLVPSAAVWALSRTVGDAGRGPSGRARLLGTGGFGSRIPTLGLALVALPPALIFAAAMIRTALEGEPEPDYTYVFDHYPIQAASVLVIPMATALLALRLPGWRPMTIVVAVGTAWYGLVSIVHPDHLGSWGAAWGWTGVAWAVALSALVFVPGDDGRERLRAAAASG
jgi:hypothetical protein